MFRIFGKFQDSYNLKINNQIEIQHLILLIYQAFGRTGILDSSIHLAKTRHMEVISQSWSLQFNGNRF